MAKNWFLSNTSITANSPGSRIDYAIPGMLEFDDLNSDTVEPIWLKPALMMNGTTFLKMFSLKKQLRDGNTSYGNPVIRMIEQDNSPIAVNSVGTRTSADAYVLLDSLSGITIRQGLFVPDTGEIMVVTSWYMGGAVTSPPAPATIVTNLAANTAGFAVQRGFAGTTAQAIPAGSRIVPLAAYANEGGRRTYGTSNEFKDIYCQATDFRFTNEYTAHVEQIALRSGNYSISDKERMFLNDTALNIDKQLLYGRSTITTSGGFSGISSYKETVTGLALPSGTAQSNDFRTGAGIIQQIEDGGVYEDMGGGFDIDIFNNIVYTTTQKSGAKRMTLFTGYSGMESITTAYRGDRESSRINHTESKWVDRRISQIECQGAYGSVVVDIITTPIMSEVQSGYDNMGILLDLNNIHPFYLQGLYFDGSLTRDRAENDRWGKVNEAMGNMGILLKNRDQSAIVRNM